MKIEQRGTVGFPVFVGISDIEVAVGIFRIVFYFADEILPVVLFAVDRLIIRLVGIERFVAVGRFLKEAHDNLRIASERKKERQDENHQTAYNGACDNQSFVLYFLFWRFGFVLHFILFFHFMFLLN